MRILPALLVACNVAACQAWAQDGNNADDVNKGHELAIRICSNCHVAARDQPYKPILQPPAPSFESLVQRANLTAESIAAFLATTHKGLDRPKGMPNPDLLDYQRKQVATYLMSLRNVR
jgi:mono/diheme cytochrome c family protein